MNREPRATEEHFVAWAIIFLLIALNAAALGFSGLAGAAEELAKIVSFVAMVLFAVALLLGRTRAGAAAAVTAGPLKRRRGEGTRPRRNQSGGPR